MRSNVPLRVAIYDPSGLGGICHYTFQLAESLAQAGCDVTVMAPEGYELNGLPRSFKLNILFKRSLVKSWLVKVVPGFLNGNSNHTVSTAKLDSPTASEKTQGQQLADFLRALRLLLRAAFYLLWDRPHLIHFQWLVDRKRDIYFIKCLKWLRFRIVYTAHDLLPHDNDTSENRRLFESIYQLADRVVVHAERNKQAMIEIFDMDPKKICVIPHGSNDLFFNDSASKEVARQHLDIPRYRKVILFFGVIRKYKGLEYLLNAFEEIEDHVHDAMLLIAGKVFDGDSTEFQHYSELLAQFIDKDSVRYVMEYISFDQVGYFFSAADVVVMPYTETSQSGILYSAFAAGRPVVVTDTGGLSEVVENSRSGFVVPPKDVKALSEAIIQILNSPDLMEQMGREAKSLANTAYAWKTIALKTENLYRSLTSLPSP